METTLLVTPDQLTSTASTFQSKATQVKALHDNMISKVNALSGTWTGEGSEAYRTKFAALQTAMDKINTTILEHVSDLNEIASQYSTTEAQVTSLANDLPTVNL